MGLAFLVELFPFHSRAKGITFFQWWGRMASFFNQFVNPIGLAHSGWRYYIRYRYPTQSFFVFNEFWNSYVVWLAFEIVFVYFLFPETAGRTLEELAFRTFHISSLLRMSAQTLVRSVRRRPNPCGAS